MLTLPSLPGDKKLLILGEAPGEEEEREGQPFIGASGKLLRQLFSEADLDIRQWHITNVFQQRPPNNDLKAISLPKTELRKQGLPILGEPHQKRHFLPDWYAQAQLTLEWLVAERFDFILCAGGTALWLLTGDGRIGLFRGNIFHAGATPALATFHPASVLREFRQFPIVWSDLRKVQRYLAGTLPPPLTRTFYYSPTEEELQHVYDLFSAAPNATLGVDIETAPSIAQITTISFATPTLAICIPIWDKYGTVHTGLIHASPDDELRAWRWIERFSRLPNPKVLQNGLYDMQYLLEAPLPIRLRNVTDDTNILSHALEIELPKDLGMLASTWLSEPGWKQMRTKHADEKAED